MAQTKFVVTALWDDEAQVFYCESNIHGLHIEAETIEEFEEILQEVGPALIFENHFTKKDMTRKSLMEMIPSILLRQRGREATAA